MQLGVFWIIFLSKAERCSECDGCFFYNRIPLNIIWKGAENKKKLKKFFLFWAWIVSLWAEDAQAVVECVCECVQMRERQKVCVCVHVCACMCACICMHVYGCVRVCACACMCVYVRVRICECACMCVFVYVRLCWWVWVLIHERDPGRKGHSH